MPNDLQRQLPTKTCPACGRPFTWRKKWQRDWPRVKYCSKRCAAHKDRPSDKRV